MLTFLSSIPLAIMIALFSFVPCFLPSSHSDMSRASLHEHACHLHFALYALIKASLSLCELLCIEALNAALTVLLKVPGHIAQDARKAHLSSAVAMARRLRVGVAHLPHAISTSSSFDVHSHHDRRESTLSLPLPSPSPPPASCRFPRIP